MLFAIIIIYVNQLKYSSGEYFGYLIVSIGLVVSRAYILIINSGSLSVDHA
jgi:hypothetical protein